MQKLTIMRGIPGSGKSHYAKAQESKPIICSADHYFTDKDTGEYNFDISKIGDAHSACFTQAMELLRDGALHVIIDNTNLSRWEFYPYVMLGRSFGAQIELVYMDTAISTCIERQVHGVPPENIEKMAARYEEPMAWVDPKQTVYKV